jgi:serine/threonine protein kinase
VRVLICLSTEQGLAKLDHPNIVRILGYSYGNWPNDSGEQKKSNMMLLTICETDLEKMIYGKDQKRPTLHDDYTPQLMVKLIREIIAGLCYCHSKGVCHLDFKPENCLLAKEDDSGKWTAKIADFGAEVVRKTNLLRHFILKTIMLPRQARDKH